MLLQRIRGVAGIINFFIPVEVLTALMLVFASENVVERIFRMYIPPRLELTSWILAYIIGITLLGLINYWGADEEELEDLSEDIEDL